MSPERIALIVTVLWGLTALWLAYRTVRGRRVRHPVESFAERSNGLWLCGTCLSLNRRDVNVCYNCRTANGFSGGQRPGELPLRRGVPVMAEGIRGAETPGELPLRRGVPVMAEGIRGAETPGELPFSRGVSVIAESSGGSSVDGTTVAIATPRNTPPAREILVGAPERLMSAAAVGAPASVIVCPFLGFRDDPSTRYDFPDPANLCHATAGRGTSSLASPQRLVTRVTGSGGPQLIAAQHQTSRCLTAEHQLCARFPAVEVVTAKG